MQDTPNPQNSSGSINKSVRIIGIDPGLRNLGWGVVESDGVRLRYIASGTIHSTPDEDLAYRLRELHDGLSTILTAQKPQEAAVEETFVNTNARSALKLGQARGIALLVPARHNLRVGEYAANVIKKTVVGAGHADKKQIQTMVGFLLPQAKFETADEADALAIAICHANHRTSPQARAVREAQRSTKRVKPGARASARVTA